MGKLENLVMRVHSNGKLINVKYPYRSMRIDSVGNKKSFNDFKESGQFAITTRINDRPYGDKCLLEVYRVNSTFIYQIVRPLELNNTPRYRCCFKGHWLKWSYAR